MKSVDGDLAKLSKQVGLVDQLMTRQQAMNFMRSKFGGTEKMAITALAIIAIKKRLHSLSSQLLIKSP